MAKFLVEALDAAGRMHADTVEAATAQEAIIALRQQGFHTYSVRPQGMAGIFSRGRRPLKAEELALLSEQLAGLVQGGLPLAPALKGMALEIRNRRLSRILRDAQQDIEQGKSMEEAFGRHAGQLPPVFFGLLRAGEQTGNLPAVLRQLTDYSQGMLRLKYRLQAVLTYPLVLVVFLLLYLGIFVNIVGPQFAATYHSFGRTLPGPTVVLLHVSNAVLVVGYPLLLLGGLTAIAAMLLGRATARSSTAGVWADQLKLRVPFIGGLYRTALNARFCRTLGLLLSNGASIMESLPLAGAATGSRVYDRAARHAAGLVGNGTTVSEAVAAMGLLRHSASWMLRHGEQNGALEQTLLRLADLGERDAERREQYLLSVLGPVMVSIFGLVVGGTSTALFMPILQLSNLVRM